MGEPLNNNIKTRPLSLSSQQGSLRRERPSRSGEFHLAQARVQRGDRELCEASLRRVPSRLGESTPRSKRMHVAQATIRATKPGRASDNLAQVRLTRLGEKTSTRHCFLIQQPKPRTKSCFNSIQIGHNTNQSIQTRKDV